MMEWQCWAEMLICPEDPRRMMMMSLMRLQTAWQEVTPLTSFCHCYLSDHGHHHHLHPRRHLHHHLGPCSNENVDLFTNSQSTLLIRHFLNNQLEN